MRRSLYIVKSMSNEYCVTWRISLSQITGLLFDRAKSLSTTGVSSLQSISFDGREPHPLICAWMYSTSDALHAMNPENIHKIELDLVPFLSNTLPRCMRRLGRTLGKADPPSIRAWHPSRFWCSHAKSNPTGITIVDTLSFATANPAEYPLQPKFPIVHRSFRPPVTQYSLLITHWNAASSTETISRPGCSPPPSASSAADPPPSPSRPLGAFHTARR